MPARAKIRVVNYSNELKKAPGYGFNPVLGRTVKFCCPAIKYPSFCVRTSLLDGGRVSDQAIIIFDGGSPSTFALCNYSG